MLSEAFCWALVMSVSDQVLALNFGRRLTFGPPEMVRHAPALAAAYLGEPAAGYGGDVAIPANVEA